MARRAKRKARKESSRRARRFSVRAPVRYRTDGEDRWHSGMTENVGRSGVLIRGEEPLMPDTPIELIVDLPAVLADEPSATVICRGRIVRSEAPAHVGDGELLAAEISSYRLVRTPSR